MSDSAHVTHAIVQQIERCANAIAQATESGEAWRSSIEACIDSITEVLRTGDERFAFDREGRPGAIAAVREALPAIERDLYDAVLDDHACELAAVKEAWARTALELRHRLSSSPR